MCINVEDVLAGHELVQIKLRVKKKSEANELGLKIAEASSSLLAQTVGHSILLYRPSQPTGRVTKLLNAALMRDNENEVDNESHVKVDKNVERVIRSSLINNSPPSVILSDDHS